MLKDFVFNLDALGRLGGDLFSFGGDGADNLANVLDLFDRVVLPRRFDAWHLRGGVEVDADNLCLCVRRGNQLRPEHALAINVVRIFGGAGGFQRAIDAIDAFADQRPLIRGGPFCVCHITRLLSRFGSRRRLPGQLLTRRRRRATCRHRCRNGTGSRRVPSAPGRAWRLGFCERMPWTRR